MVHKLSPRCTTTWSSAVRSARAAGAPVREAPDVTSAASAGDSSGAGGGAGARQPGSGSDCQSGSGSPGAAARTPERCTGSDGVATWPSGAGVRGAAAVAVLASAITRFAADDQGVQPVLAALTPAARSRATVG